jgi:hypothetical protein
MQADPDGSLARKKMDPKKTRKVLVQKQEECVKEFNRTLSQISKAMYNKNKLDNDILEMKEHLDVALKEVPLDIFERVGEYVWKYREEIAVGKIDNFIKKDYKEEVIAEMKKGADYNADESEIQRILTFITTVKRTWRFFNPNEQTDMTKKFQDLLRHYATHEDCRRQIKKIDDKLDENQ